MGALLFVLHACLRRLSCSAGITSLAVVLIACSTLAAEAPAAPGRVLVLDNQDNYPAGYQTDYLLHPFAETFEAIRYAVPDSAWQPNAKALISLGYQQDGSWIRLRLENPSSEVRRWLLVAETPLIDQLELRLFDPVLERWSSVESLGNRIPLSRQATSGPYPVATLDLPPNQAMVLYGRMRASQPLTIPMEIMSPAAYERIYTQTALSLSAFLGAAVIMLAYNLSLYVFIRDRAYLWYSGYLAGAIFYMVCATGFGRLYLWPEWTELAVRATVLSISLCMAGAAQFIKHFLQLSSHSRFFSVLCKSFLIYWLGASLIIAIDPAFIPFLGIDVMVFLSCLTGLWVGLALWWRGHVSARYFTIAWIVLNLATLYMTLVMSGLSKGWVNPLYVQMLGFALEFLLLSMALAERINRERAARIQAKQEAIRTSEHLARERLATLQAQEKLLIFQQETNEALERRVKERTLALEEANLQLSRLSRLDALTQLQNRSAFEENFTASLAQALATGQMLSVVMIDIDHFKQINDTYGHSTGDECLVKVGQVLLNHTQEAGDHAARFGGEEFILLFMNRTPTEMATLVERIRLDMASLGIKTDSGTLRFTVSIGVECRSPRPDDTRVDYSRAADTALYQAKAAGRNQSCFAITVH